MTDKKDFKDIDPKDLKITFAPGCFDSFEGTQEELDELINEITKMVENGEIQDRSHELTEEEWDELPDEVKMQIMQAFSEEDLDDESIEQIETDRRRRLQ